MESEDFFVLVEKRLQVNISQRIKAHLQFHNMNNVLVASGLTKQNIVEIENFARSTLHQILQPDEMGQFYGSHFQNKPELFVFTLGERKHLSGIKQVCEEICEERETCSEEYEIECDSKKSSEKLTNSSDHVENSKQQIELKNSPEEDETNKTRGLKKEFVQDSCPGKDVNRNTPLTTMICLKNLGADTSDTELTFLAKPYGPIRWQFLAKNRDTGLCNGIGCVDFKCRDDAIRAIELLNGCKYKERILAAQWWSPRPKKRAPKP